MEPYAIVVIGASSGGLAPLREIVGRVPGGVRAAICVAVHTSPTAPSLLPRILERSGRLRAMHATDGQNLSPSAIYVAPPNRHLLVRGDHLRLSIEAAENGRRPSIDVMFQSAALSHGPRVVGVVLSGSLDDGTAGLREIKRHGGLAIVQDPGEARSRSMPESAIDNVPVDHVLSAPEIATLLTEAASSASLERFIRAAPPGGPPIIDERVEGRPSAFSCPACRGVLFERKDGDFFRYRCRTGHAYSPLSLEAAQSISTEEALWSAVRALEERAAASRRLGESARNRGRGRISDNYFQRADLDEQRAAVARRALEMNPPAPVEDEVTSPEET
jgi:two-component system chemotaxis response regulator CheB